MTLLTKLSRLCATGLLITLMSLSGPSFAQQADSPEAEAIMAILEAGSSEPVSFDEAFREAVSIDEVNAVIAEVASTMGPPQSITPRAEGFEVRSASHKINVRISFNDAGEVDGLFFSPLVAVGMSVQDAAAALAAIEGDSALLVLRNGDPVVSENADADLAVASGFKLGVLSVLNAQMETGQHGWEEVVTLEERHRSLPTGRLQTFPAGSPVTLHTAAALMISESDNTATDLLMQTVGRDAVNAALDQVVPTTRELFQLKSDSAIQADYIAADQAGRLVILDGLANTPLPPPNATSGMHVQGFGWQVSVTDLCGLITPLAGLDLFRINPGIASEEDWQQVAFKGGSLPGVLSLTTSLQDAAGNDYCVAYTLNKTQAINEQEVYSAYAVLLSALNEADGVQ